MKHAFRSVWLTCCLAGVAAHLARGAEDEPRRSNIGWIVDVQPASVFANFASDEFEAVGTAEIGGTSYTTKETMSLLSTLPSLSAGMTLDLADMTLAGKLGGAMYLNSHVRSPVFQAGLDLMFEMKRSILVGPRAALLWFKGADWWGDGDIELADSTVGYMVGLQFVLGDKIAYLFSVDYMVADVDVENLTDLRTPGGWAVSDDAIELGGLAVQFGLRASF